MCLRPDVYKRQVVAVVNIKDHAYDPPLLMTTLRLPEGMGNLSSATHDLLIDNISSVD